MSWTIARNSIYVRCIPSFTTFTAYYTNLPLQSTTVCLPSVKQLYGMSRRILHTINLLADM
jgi:hypothetical protein